MTPLSELDWTVRAAVYAAFAGTGRAPELDDLARAAGTSTERTRAALGALHEAHQLVVDPDGERVIMAHPFSGVPTDFPVETPTLSTWANCAWDALGVPAVLGSEARTRTTCARSGAALEFGVRAGTVEGDPRTVVHLLTPLRRAWDDIGFT